MKELVESLSLDTQKVLKIAQRSLAVIRIGRHSGAAGVIWRSDGLIITNNHVLRRGHIQAILGDDKDTEFEAKLVARDANMDLALLMVEGHDTPAALIADSRALRVGEFVMAVGHPWGMRGFVTAGAINGLGSAAINGSRRKIDILRTDVRLAPGNSGGPLVNAAGAVVGINTMIVGGDLGIAIPSHVINKFVEDSLTFPKGFMKRKSHNFGEQRTM